MVAAVAGAIVASEMGRRCCVCISVLYILCDHENWAPAVFCLIVGHKFKMTSFVVGLSVPAFSGSMNCWADDLIRRTQRGNFGCN